MIDSLLNKARAAKRSVVNSVLFGRLPRVDADDDETPFPPVDKALRQPNGLLAVGGSLRPRRLEQAYRSGIFPYFTAKESIRWWSPDPRCVLFPADIRISTSLRKCIRQGHYQVTCDQAFSSVMHACAAPRPGVKDTWITPAVLKAYQRLFDAGNAHSMEVWKDGELVGGCYGVALGAAFFGESMFSRARDASKVALVYQARQLERWGYRLIDCQFPTPHLISMGAVTIPRREYLEHLRSALRQPGRSAPWRFDPDFDPLAG